jgi:hypothetical protein
MFVLIARQFYSGAAGIYKSRPSPQARVGPNTGNRYAKT